MSAIASARPALFATLLLTTAAWAQSQPTPEFAVPALATASVTTDELGRPIAIGPDWECEFDAAGARFLPVLGNRSPVLMDLRLRAASVRRGASTMPLAAEVAPVVAGDRVSYPRAAGVVERFDATAAGLEHSLVLERPIVGQGDLVVTIATGGGAAPHGRPADGGGLCFSQGQGGVDYGALTAIAADGASCAGALRLVPGAIEWVVPADFVERAAFPLLLDPLVGGNFQITFPVGGPFAGPWEADVRSDVAYDLSTDSYLVVWERLYSSGGAGQSSIRAQRRASDGSALGSILAVSLVDTSTAPRVANVNLSNRFVVVWSYLDFFGTSQVRMRSVAASDGTMSSSGFVTSQNVGDIRGCDVAGESGTSSTLAAEAWVVWTSQSQGVRGARLSVPASSTSLTVAGTFGVEPAAPGQYWPRISRVPTTDGRLGVAWLSAVTTTSMQVRAAVIDRAGAVVNPDTLVFAAAEMAITPPAIDGGTGASGSEFVVAFESAAPLGGNNFNTTLRAASLVSGAQLTVGTPVALANEPNNSYAPAVGWRSGKAYVAYTDLLQTRMVLRGIDPRTCLTCEANMTVSTVSTAVVLRPALCMDRTGGSNFATTGLLVWDQQTSGIFEGSIRGRFVDAFSSAATTTSLGGACGSAGATTTSGPPAVGNGQFQLRLLSPGATALVAVLNLAAPTSVPLVCGTCQWLPFEATVALTVSQPLTVAPLPIPCTPSLAGATLDAQWTVWKPGTTPCAIFPDFALSNILRLNFQ